MRNGTYGYSNSAKSVRLFKTRNSNFSISCLLSYSPTTTALPHLVYLTMGRSTDGTTPAARAFYLYGTTASRLPIKYKVNSDNSVSVYVVRTEYTPVFGAVLLAGIGQCDGLMTALDDNSEIDSTCVDFTVG